MKQTWYIITFELIKRIFVRLLTGLVNGSNHAKCGSLSSQNCLTQTYLINLHPTEHSQEYHYVSIRG